MSENIEERVVSMQLNNAQFERSAAQTLKTLDELKKGLNFSNEINQTSSSDLSALGKSIDAIADKFSLMGMIATNALNRISNYVVNLGEKMVRNLGINQITAGMSKYEKKTSATYTIKSALPDTDLSEIEAQLADLSKYTDDTSYDFVAMVESIGKFTANGVELGKAVEAMKGIGNEAAKSGAGIQEANRAMYNFAQALSTGAVTLMDWKSIENANMATKEFKQTIIDTAVELGELKKSGDKITTKKGTLVDYTKFNSTLSERWFTSDVLIKTLNKYADRTTKFGNDAFLAAQQATTFGQAIDAINDSVSSGWMQSFSYIFGNLDESIELWTMFCNSILEVTGAIDEYRNGILEAWHDSDVNGRADMLKALTTVISSLWNAIIAVKDGFADIVPPITVDTLTGITAKVGELADKLSSVFTYIKAIKGEEEEEEIAPISKALDAELQKGAKGDGVKELQQMLTDLGYDVGKAGVDGIFGKDTEAALKQYQKDVKATVNGIWTGELWGKKAPDKTPHNASFEMQDEIDNAEGVRTSTIDKLINIGEGLGGIFLMIKSISSQIFSSVVDIASVFLPLLDPIMTILSMVGQAVGALGTAVSESTLIKDAAEKIKNFLEPISESISGFLENVINFFSNGEVEDSEKTLMSFSEIIEKIKTTVTEFFDREDVKARIESITSAFNSAKEAIVGVYNTVKDFIVDKFNEWFGKGEDESKKFDWVTTVLDSITSAIEWLSDKASKAINWVTNLFSTIFGFFSGSNAEDGMATFSDYWGSFTQGIKDFFGREDIQAKIESITTAFNSFKEGIVNLYNTAKTYLSGKLSGLFEKTGEESEDSISPLTTILDGIVNGFAWITEKADNAVKVVTEFFTNLKAKLAENPLVSEETQNNEAAEDVANGKTATFWDKFKEGLGKVKEAILGIGGFIADIITWCSNHSGLFLGIAIFTLLNIAIFKIVGGIKDLLKTVAKIKGVDEEEPKKDGTKFLKVAAGWLMIAGSVALIMESIKILGEMDTNVLIQGSIAVGVIVAILVGITLLLSKIGKKKGGGMENAGRSLLELSLSIAILAGVAFLLGNIKDWAKFTRGAIAVLALLGVLGLIVVGVNKLGGAKLEVKGMVELAGAVAILGGVAIILGLMPPRILWRGIAAVAALGLIVAGMVALMSIKSDGNVDIKGIFMMSLSILILGDLAIVLGLMPAKIIWKGVAVIAALGAIIAGIAIAFKYAKPDKGAMGSIVLIGLILAGLAITLAIAINMVKDVDPTVMIAFLSGLVVLIGGLLATSVVIGKMKGGAKNMITGAAAIGASLAIIVSIVTALVAGLGALDNLTGGGLTYSINSGIGVLTALADGLAGLDDGFLIGVGACLVFSEIIGKIPGGATAMIAGATSIGVAFDLLILLVGGLLTGLGALDTWISDEGGESVLVDLINKGGAILGAISGAIGTFVTSFFQPFIDQFGEFVGHVGELIAVIQSVGDTTQFGEQLTAVVTAVSTVSTFFTDLTAYEFTGSELSGYATAPAQLSTDMGLFATAFGSLVTNIAGISKTDTLDEDIASAIEAASALHGFFADLTPYALLGTEMSGQETAATQLSTDIFNFGTAIGSVMTNIAGISKTDTLDEDITAAIEVAKTINGFFNDIATQYSEMDSASIRNYETAVSGTLGDIDKFGTTMGDFATHLSTVDSTTLQTQTEAAIGAATQVATFLQTLAGLEGTIEENKIGLSAWFGTDTTANTVIETAGKLGETIGQLWTDLKDVDDASVSSKMTNVNDIMTKFATVIDTMQAAGKDENGDFDLTQFVNAVAGLPTIGSKIADFEKKVKDVDLSVVNDALTSVGGLAPLIASTNGIANGKTAAKVVGDFLGNLDDSLSGLTFEFSSEDAAAVSDFMTNLERAFNGHMGMFENVGENISAGVGQGIRRGDYLALNAINSLSQHVIDRLKEKLGIHSPSKVFSEFGNFLDLGLAGGIISGEPNVANALTSLSELVASGIDTTPVIRPVVDMSNITSGANAINDMLSAKRSLSIGTSIGAASSVDRSNMRNNQNGASVTNYNDSNTVSVNGNNFYVREEADVQSIAEKIAAMMKKQNRSLGKQVSFG